MKQLRLMFIVLLSITITVLAGCQDINGVDLNQSLYNPTDISYEGKATISLDVNYDESLLNDSMDKENADKINLFQNLKINLNSIKVQNADTMSVDGSIEVSKGTVPFRLSTTKDEMIVQLVGAGQPIVIRQLGMRGFNPDSSGLNEDATQKLRDSMDQIQDLVTGYVIKQLPNPKNISVSPEQITINTETVNVQHIDANMNFGDLTEYVISFLNNILNDKPALESLVGQMIDLLVPIYASQINEPDVTEEDMLQQVKDGKADMVNQIYSMVQSAHDELVINQADPAANNMIPLDGNSTLDVDLYVDDQYNTRKSKFELLLKPPSAKDGQSVIEDMLKSVRLTVEEEKWNLKGDVVADVIEPGPNPIIVDENMRPRKMMRAMNAGSIAYDILRNDFHVTRQSVTFNTIPTMNSTTEPTIQPTFIKGSAMVPLRSVSKQFETTLLWDKNTNEIELYDEGKRIVIPLDSKLLYVDGNKKFLGLKVYAKDGVTYVPARTTFKNFGAKVDWNHDAKEIVITRD